MVKARDEQRRNAARGHLGVFDTYTTRHRFGLKKTGKKRCDIDPHAYRAADSCAKVCHRFATAPELGLRQAFNQEQRRTYLGVRHDERGREWLQVGQVADADLWESGSSKDASACVSCMYIFYACTATIGTAEEKRRTTWTRQERRVPHRPRQASLAVSMCLDPSQRAIMTHSLPRGAGLCFVGELAGPSISLTLKGMVCPFPSAIEKRDARAKPAVNLTILLEGRIRGRNGDFGRVWEVLWGVVVHPMCLPAPRPREDLLFLGREPISADDRCDIVPENSPGFRGSREDGGRALSKHVPPWCAYVSGLIARTSFYRNAQQVHLGWQLCVACDSQLVSQEMCVPDDHPSM